MKKYRVNVNGTVYEVEIEEMAGAPADAPIPVAAPKAEAPVAGEKIAAPMPGNILDVRVKKGDMVRAGQVLMILEAMKMENEIMCPRDGRIGQVCVNKGDTVDPETVLCILE